MPKERDPIQTVSYQFSNVANWIVKELPMEAKDCAVRAKIYKETT